MPNVIKPKRRTGSTGVPNVSSMQDGEIAINSFDKKVWMRVGSNLVEIANAAVSETGQGATGTWGISISGLAAQATLLRAATNVRDVKPSTSGTASTTGAIPFFVSRQQIEGGTGNNYGDFLILDTYSDASGGKVNGLFFDKQAHRMLHYQGGWNAASWDAPKEVAYTDSSITGNAATATRLVTARTINGVSFDGTANITLTAAAPNALTFGNGLAAGSYTGAAATTVALGTPSTLSGTTTNSVTATSHTHALSTNLSAWDGLHPNAVLHKGFTIENFAGSFGTQVMLQLWGWNNGVTRWAPVLESDASLGWYSYNMYGGSGVRLMTWRTTSAGGSNHIDINGGLTVGAHATVTGGVTAAQGTPPSGGGTSCYFANGPFGQQVAAYAIQWEGNRIWQIGAEDNGDFKLWSYTGTGAYQGNPLTVTGSGITTIRGPGGSTGDLALISYAPTIRFRDTDTGADNWIHCNDNQLGFLANNAWAWAAYRNSVNDWACTGNVIAYASDASLKTNIVDVDSQKVADFFDRFRVREFDWDKEAIEEKRPTFHPTSDHEIGAIAQEVEEFFPGMVAEHDDGIKTLMWEKAVPLLIAEVQALRKRVEELENR